MPHQITCITKPDPHSSHEAILRIGGIAANGTHFNISREDCYDNIKGGHVFHVKVGNADAKVEAYQRNGQGKYIRTFPDATKKDNLLNLPQCR